MPRLSPEKMTVLRRQFKKYDTSRDGSLSFKEMAVLLRKGNPEISDSEMKILYQAVDKNHDGRVDFDEFVDFIYSPPDESVPQDVKEMYSAFCDGGPTMDGVTFAKLCKDCGLVDHKLDTRDVDIIFASVKPKGERFIAFAHFSRALRKIADHKGITAEEVFETVGDAEGPHLVGTKPDAVRFHDDKGTYTGTHRTGAADDDEIPDWPGGTVSASALRRSTRKARTFTAPPAPVEDDDTNWEQVEPVFEEYSDKNRKMDGHDFAKLCRDCRFCDDKFQPHEVDVIFIAACSGSDRHIELCQFQELLRMVAARKECAPYFVLKEVLAVKGPVPKARHRKCSED